SPAGRPPRPTPATSASPVTSPTWRRGRHPRTARCTPRAPTSTRDAATPSGPSWPRASTPRPPESPRRSRVPPATPEPIHVDVGDTELGVVRWLGAPGAPLVVAVHGITANAWSWGAVARHLDGE